MTLVTRAASAVLWLVATWPSALSAQIKPPSATGDSAARADSVTQAFLEADEQFFLRRLLAQRNTLLLGAEWAELGDRCNPGALRIFPKATSAAQRDSIQRLVEQMEQTVIGRGVGARLDTPDAQALLRTIVGWEAGIDRPHWDSDDPVVRSAIATGLTGDVPDPRGTGCLASPLAGDTVTFVLPGFTTLAFPQVARPRVKAYFGASAQQNVRDEFFATRGRLDLTAELSYIVVAPVVLWRGWALVGINRPREKGGVLVGAESNGGAAYLLRKVGPEWRLLTVVRTW